LQFRDESYACVLLCALHRYILFTVVVISCYVLIFRVHLSTVISKVCFCNILY